MAAAADAALRGHSASSLASVRVRELLVDDVGATSRTARVLQRVHQGVVMPLSFAVAAHTRVLSKDVKERLGWQVDIDVARDAGGARVVRVRHTRRQQSLSDSPPESFMLQLQTTLELSGDDWSDVTRVDTAIDAAAAHPSALHPTLRSEFALLRQWNDAQV